MQKLMKVLHKSEKGFTLVELMVVVVIIGVLVAIAIPVFNLVTARAEEGACHANQRMIEGAVLQYNMGEPAHFSGSTIVPNWEPGADTTAATLDTVGGANLRSYFQDGPECPVTAATYTVYYRLLNGNVTTVIAICSAHDHHSGRYNSGSLPQ